MDINTVLRKLCRLSRVAAIAAVLMMAYPAGNVASAAPGPGRGAVGSAALAQAVSRIVDEGHSLAGSNRFGRFGWNGSGVSILGAYVAPGHSVAMWMPLNAGSTYAFLGGGNNDAQDVDIQIERGGAIVAKDDDVDNGPVVIYAPPVTDKYLVTMKLYRAPVSCFLALAVLTTGSDGYSVPIDNLAKAIAKSLVQTTLIADAAGDTQFHRQENQWAMFGQVLAPGGSLKISTMTMEDRLHAITAVGDDAARDLDLFVRRNGSLLGSDEDDDPTPAVAAQTPSGSGYEFEVKNVKSAGPTLVVATIVDVGTNGKLARANDAEKSAPAPGPASPQGRAGMAYGTGFFVSSDGLALTNNHVTDRCRSITAKYDGRAFPASVVRRDSNVDLALLRVQTPTAVPYARFRAYASGSIRAGDHVLTAGFPLSTVLGNGLNVTAGNVSALAGLGGNTTLLQVTAPVQAGNSGGPLLDASGNVVGVVVSKLDAARLAQMTGDLPQNVNFAVKGPVARLFIESDGQRAEEGGAATKLSEGDLSDRARTFTFQIECAS